MRQTAVIVAPGRGTYNRSELGYFAQHHQDKAGMLAEFDMLREVRGQKPLSELDGAARFSGAQHTRGDNASALIYACSYADYLSVNREAFDIIGVTGNSMGWYTALACAGAVGSIGGLDVVNTMGSLMQEHLIGGQLIYPFVDEDWCEVPGQRAAILAKVAEIDARKGHALSVSIDLGGMLVLAGCEAGLAAFEAEMPRIEQRFPMRLPYHAGFHSHLQEPVAKAGRAQLARELFSQPETTLIDGRGCIWRPGASDVDALYDYTLGHQVVETYDYTAAIRVAARELMPDVFIVLGPGTTLGGATAQSLLMCGWRGMVGKAGFQAAQADSPRLISLGRDDQRSLAV